MTANATTGTTFSRPVTTFNSTAEETPMDVSGIPSAGSGFTYFDPVTRDVVISRSDPEQRTCTVVCTDITGRTLARRVFPSGAGAIRIPIADYHGVVVVFALSTEGTRTDLGRINSIR